MNYFIKLTLPILLVIIYFGCSPPPRQVTPPQPVIQPKSPPSITATPARKQPKSVRTQIINEFKKWEGTPHRMGGYSKKGIDCSGFAHYIYTHLFHIDVPRTTKQFLVAGVQIKKSQLQPGDIVLFKPHSYPRHVGIYVGNNKFIHASSSKGVIMSDLDNPYWKKHYKMSRRILFNEEGESRQL